MSGDEKQGYAVVKMYYHDSGFLILNVYVS